MSSLVLSCGSLKKFMDFEWNFHASNGGLYLSCMGNKGNIWRIDTKVRCTMFEDGVANKELVYVLSFDEYNTNHYLGYFCGPEVDFDLWTQKFGQSFTCVVEIQSIGLLYTPKHDFTKMDIFNNFVIKVDDKRLYINKDILSIASPLFEELVEQGCEQVRAKNVDFEEFEKFLQVVYGYEEVDESNLDYLLPLAHRFQVEAIIKKCEYILIFSTEKSAREKLILSEMFGLARVKTCVFTIITKQELRDITMDNSGLSDETIRELIDVYARMG